MKDKILFSYKKSEYLDDLKDFLENSYNDNSNNLNEICLSQLYFLCKKLEIKTQILKESDIMNIEKTQEIDASERLLNHAKITNANIYLTGINSKNYLNENLFKENNLIHLVQKFDYKKFLDYQNCTEPLSIVHQIAKIGYSEIKNNLNNFQTTKKDIINK